MLLLGGLLVWFLHFFLLYAFASIFPGSDTARWLTAGATLLGLVAIGAIIRAAIPGRKKCPGDEIDHWTWQVVLPGCVLSLAAVLWQGLTVFF